MNKTMTHSQEVIEAIIDFVSDHYKHFDAYPMDVEIDEEVLDWEQYWAILDSVGFKYES